VLTASPVSQLNVNAAYDAHKPENSPRFFSCAAHFARPAGLPRAVRGRTSSLCTDCAGMEQGTPPQGYYCPIHSAVRQAGPGKCPECGVKLLPKGTRFAMLRHMMSNPTHMLIMAALMAGVMAAAMMLVR
jgi:Heavy metal binding domain